jgi:hypothetical protein
LRNRPIQNSYISIERIVLVAQLHGLDMVRFKLIQPSTIVFPKLHYCRPWAFRFVIIAHSFGSEAFQERVELVARKVTRGKQQKSMNATLKCNYTGTRICLQILFWTDIVRALAEWKLFRCNSQRLFEEKGEERSSTSGKRAAEPRSRYHLTWLLPGISHLAASFLLPPHVIVFIIIIVASPSM